MTKNIIRKNLSPININLEIPSAQIKSGLLLASLYINGETKITENKINILRETYKRLFIPLYIPILTLIPF